MSDQNQETESQDTQPSMQQLDPKDEVKMLKQRCDLMGIPYGPNSGVDTLRKKIADRLGDQGTPAVAELQEAEAIVKVAEIPAQNPEVAALQAQVTELMDQMRKMAASQTPTENPFREPNYGPGGSVRSPKLRGGGRQISNEVRQACIKEAMKLVRIRITCMNPSKKGVPGEVVCVGNSAIGTIKKFVPFDPAFSENGYHVPKIIYEELKAKEFVNIRTTRDRRTGTEVVSDSMAKEFAIEVLPDLTPEEIASLARQQAAAGAIDTEHSLQ